MPWRVKLVIKLQYCQEGILGNFYAADLLHAFFACLLFFQQFPFTRDITTITFGSDIFTQGPNRFTSNNFLAYGSLNGHLKLLAGN
jgi:hypothetical protein